MTIQNFLTAHQPKNGRFFTIAIDGRGGSGKSTLAKLLKTKLSGFVILNGDDYFEPGHDPIVWGDFNDARFVHDVIAPLKTQNDFAYRPYDWHAEPHITEQNVQVTKGFCLERGIVREHMPKDRVLAAWKIWQQQEDDYIRDFRPQERADVILDGTKPLEEQLQ